MLGPIVLPLGAVVTTGIVVAEALFVSEALGTIYERLDVTSIERPD